MTSTLRLPDGLDVHDIDFAKQSGLVPAVVQHHVNGTVLMVGYQDAAALTATLETGLATFFSRSRREQWVKGATSGSHLHVTAVQVDCDRDTVLLLCAPDGPTCHTGAESCFQSRAESGLSSRADGVPPVTSDHSPLAEPGRQSSSSGSMLGTGAFLGELEQVVRARDRERPPGSYTTSLLEGGVRRIAQKVGEEGVETALAAVAQGDPELVGESADLIYHLMVLLRARGLGLAEVEAELRRRHG